LTDWVNPLDQQNQTTEQQADKKLEQRRFHDSTPGFKQWMTVMKQNTGQPGRDRPCQTGP
jgi:hypothetical protein